MTSYKDLNILNSDEIQNLEWKWDDKAIRHGAIADGGCYFHSILTSLSKEYRNASSRRKGELCKELRKDISDSITDDKFKTYKIENRFVSEDNSYKKMSGESSYDAYKRYVSNPYTHVGSEVLQATTDYFNIDIYIVKNGELYNQPVPHDDSFKKRDSIILLHNKSHYESIGIYKKDIIVYFFERTSPIVIKLYEEQKKGWEIYKKIMS